MTTPRIVIVGGGMAGLAAAWECHRRGLTATVLEADARPGGVGRTIRAGDLVLDGGADAFLASKPGALTVSRELGLETELVTMLPPRGAFIRADGQFHPLPEGGALGVPVSPRAFLSSRLLTWRGKIRVAAEPFVRKFTWPAEYDESAAAFFRRRFGPEVAERIAQPLLGGIHAGRLEDLSARAVLPQMVAIEADGRSVWLTLRRQGRRAHPGGVFRSFRTGMGRLPEALAEALPPGTVRTSMPVDRVEATDGSGTTVHPTGGSPLAADILLVAVPAWRAVALFSGEWGDAARLCATGSWGTGASRSPASTWVFMPCSRLPKIRGCAVS
jgi:oxygen-dependent protoporphyrinogen oxidase